MDGHVDFRVRRANVLSALQWLIANNPFYGDITINYEVIASLPEDGNIANNSPFLTEREIVHEDIESNCVHENGIPVLYQENQRNLITTSINWPTANPNPVNEFRHAGYIVKAFPHLFPYGKADFHDTTRPIKITLREWTQHLMRHSDKRFAQDPRFRYFCKYQQLHGVSC